MIATTKLAALNNKSVQDIETWDDHDESTAQTVADLTAQKQSIVAAGDDAQLLAGATIATLSDPKLYETAGALLDDALDDSYERDPIGEAYRLIECSHQVFLLILLRTSKIASKRCGAGPRQGQQREQEAQINTHIGRDFVFSPIAP